MRWTQTLTCTLSVVLTWTLLAPGAPRALEYDGNYLLAKCAVALRIDGGAVSYVTSQEGYDMGLCYGIIMTVMREHEACAMRAGEPLPFCVPSSATLSQGVRVVHRYLQQHPERLHLPQGDLILEAHRVAFPCAAPTVPMSPMKQRR